MVGIGVFFVGFLINKDLPTGTAMIDTLSSRALESGVKIWGNGLMCFHMLASDRFLVMFKLSPARFFDL